MSTHILSQVVSVEQAVRELDKRGLVVNRIVVDGFGVAPTIDLCKSAACDALGGISVFEANEHGNYDRYLAAHLCGCRVRWRQL